MLSSYAFLFRDDGNYFYRASCAIETNLFAGRVFHETARNGIQRVVRAGADTGSGNDRTARLADDDVADIRFFSVVEFESAVLGATVATQLRRPDCFCMCHGWLG